MLGPEQQHMLVLEQQRMSVLELRCTAARKCSIVQAKAALAAQRCRLRAVEQTPTMAAKAALVATSAQAAWAAPAAAPLGPDTAQRQPEAVLWSLRVDRKQCLPGRRYLGMSLAH